MNTQAKYLDRAINDGYAHIIGEKGKQKITYVSSDNHSENYSDPEEKVRAEFWAELIYKYEYPVNRIKIIQKTKGHGLAKIVDAILRAKGFTTYVSPAGPDKGVDILASAGTLGFGSPKICVQVKSTDAPVDRIVLDQLGGVMKNFGAEYGLLVSWSGFKSSVINETAKQFFEIRLWTHKEIIEEFLRYYDQMDDEIKELIPLKKIWVVNNNEE